MCQQPSRVQAGVRSLFAEASRSTILLGFAGSAVIAAGSFRAGGVPVIDWPSYRSSRYEALHDVATGGIYLGITLLAWSWIRLGRDVLVHRIGSRAVLISSAFWALPMFVSYPLFTRDPYHYVAFGVLSLQGYDPYSVGSSAAPEVVSGNVHPYWRDHPAPYGPLFIAVARAAVSWSGDDPLAGVLSMRLIMTLGIVPLLVGLRGLCAHCGGSFATACWVTVANPAMIVIVIGGAHNDLLMIGLLVLGCRLTLERKHLLGVACVGAALAVKAPAVIALPFLAAIWASRMGGRRAISSLKAGFAVGLICAVILAGCSALGRVGLGWIRSLDAPVSIVHWSSLSVSLGNFAYGLLEYFSSSELTKHGVVEISRIFTLVLFLVIYVSFLFRRSSGEDAIYRAAIMLLLAALLAPTTLPWYYSWGLALLAPSLRSAASLKLAAIGSMCLFVIGPYPDGEFLPFSPAVPIAIFVALMFAISLDRSSVQDLRKFSRLKNFRDFVISWSPQNYLPKIAAACARTPTTFTFLSAPLLVVAISMLLGYLGDYFMDLEVYRLGVDSWLSGHGLYGRLPRTGAGLLLPFLYPPFAALVLTPLVLVSWEVAWGVMVVFSLLALSLTIFLFLRRLFPIDDSLALVGTTALLPLCLMVEPILGTFRLGQINLILMALVTADCLTVRPRWPRGLLIGLACAIKLTPLAFALFFLLRGERRALAVMLLAFVGATGLGIVVAPSESAHYWSGAVAASTDVIASPYYSNQGLRAAFSRSGVVGDELVALWLVLCVGMILLVAPAIRRSPAPLALITCGGVSLLCSPVSWSHHWVWVAPAIIVAASMALQTRSIGWTAATAIMLGVFLWTPHDLLNLAQDAELGWSVAEQIVGSSYAILAIALSTALAFHVRGSRRIRQPETRLKNHRF